MRRGEIGFGKCNDEDGGRDDSENRILEEFRRVVREALNAADDFWTAVWDLRGSVAILGPRLGKGNSDHIRDRVVAIQEAHTNGVVVCVRPTSNLRGIVQEVRTLHRSDDLPREVATRMSEVLGRDQNLSEAANQTVEILGLLRH